MSAGSETSRWFRQPERGGLVDYRLGRDLALAGFRSGRLGRSDVCDAHPELMRAARSVGRETLEECPVCAEAKLVHVLFAFGPRLPAGGRCLASVEELQCLAERVSEASCYVVEVCPQCSWNHLAHMFLAGGGRLERRDRSGLKE
ncbi:MAG: DUF5318 family protein [Acidimicrobiales bacterium]